MMTRGKIHLAMAFSIIIHSCAFYAESPQHVHLAEPRLLRTVKGVAPRGDRCGERASSGGNRSVVVPGSLATQKYGTVQMDDNIISSSPK